jgi:hypothetical protein
MLLRFIARPGDNHLRARLASQQQAARNNDAADDAIVCVRLMSSWSAIVIALIDLNGNTTEFSSTCACISSGIRQI